VTGIETEKLEKMRTFWRTNPVSLDRSLLTTTADGSSMCWSTPTRRQRLPTR